MPPFFPYLSMQHNADHGVALSRALKLLSSAGQFYLDAHTAKGWVPNWILETSSQKVGKHSVAYSSVRPF